MKKATRAPPRAVAPLLLVRPRRTALRHIVSCCLLIFTVVGCSTLGPDPSIHVNGKPSPTWNDVREIERLLPALGIGHAITEITMDGPDRADIYCETRHPSFGGASTEGGNGIEFTVVRRGGHWVPKGRPWKSGRVILGAMNGPNQAPEPTPNRGAQPRNVPDPNDAGVF
jgi:hypothetical protein